MAHTGEPLFKNERYGVWGDRVEQGSYVARALSSTSINSNYPIDAPDAAGTPGPLRTWLLTEDLSDDPRLACDDLLSQALYHLSLQELRNDTAADGTFNAGAKWPGVWTRDVSYSILLALAAIAPETSKRSLLQKVHRGRIVQDTGTGGSWPVSTDRLVWGLAAWEIYLVTGDRAWLQQSYPILRDSILDDLEVVVDPATGLARGESSFLDWREQTYPRWMQPVDIAQSQALSTNAVFYRSLRILARMSGELQEPGDVWNRMADRIGKAVNELFWQEQAGLYGQFRYGSGVYATLSPRADALGESLAILFDLAPPARQQRILCAQPIMDFGVPTVFPQTPGIEPYHNDSVWPFVQAFFTLAAAKHADTRVVLAGIAALQRASALFLTNKENFVASTGDAHGTAVNSDRQLWSVAGNLAMTYRVLFGMQFNVDGLHLAPVVPEAMAGTRTLSNFRYREALLSIQVSGFGSVIRTCTLDGRATPPVVPANLSGAHTIVLELAEDPTPSERMHHVPSTFAPESPQLDLTGDRLCWQPVAGAVLYRVYRNGSLLATLPSLDCPAATDAYSEYQVSAVDSVGTASFLSKMVCVHSEATVVSMPDSAAHVELDRTGTTGLVLTPTVAPGRYAVHFQYSNGAGPLNSGDRCAVRTLFIDGCAAGPIVMPQRGADQWGDFGSSSLHIVDLCAGAHTLELRLLPADENMSGEENRVRIRTAVLTPLGAGSMA